MNSSIKSALISLIIVFVTAVALALLPVTVEVTPSTVSADQPGEVEKAVTTSDNLHAAHAMKPVVDVAAEAAPAAETTIREYTLVTIIGQTPAMAFIGSGGEIDGQINPTLTANVGDTVRITVINGDPVLHNLVIDEFGVHTGDLIEKDQTSVVEFVADRPGEFNYYCNIPGHREIGMAGLLKVEGEAPAGEPAAEQPVEVAVQPTALPADPNAVSIVRDPTDLPSPIGDREPMHVQVDLTTEEVVGTLADGTTFNYFTFNGKVPGPMIRVRVGDTVDLRLMNAADSLFPHSIDLHAVTGPGGGAVYTQTLPDGTTSFSFKALAPGLYVYHCATASIPHHISSGMYGLILVEPEGGLPPVDREFYVMQGEIYTKEPYGTKGHLSFSHEHMSNEQADYLVFNGSTIGLTSDEHALRANVGETVRIFFGVGGPNYTSSFHIIGEIFDRVYELASLTSEPLTNVQTTLVPPGGATIVEFQVDVPGRYILVDHALSRMERGLAGYLYVEGEEAPEIFHGNGEANLAGH